MCLGEEDAIRREAAFARATLALAQHSDACIRRRAQRRRAHATAPQCAATRALQGAAA